MPVICLPDDLKSWINERLRVPANTALDGTQSGLELKLEPLLRFLVDGQRTSVSENMPVCVKNNGLLKAQTMKALVVFKQQAKKTEQFLEPSDSVLAPLVTSKLVAPQIPRALCLLPRAGARCPLATAHATFASKLIGENGNEE